MLGTKPWTGKMGKSEPCYLLAVSWPLAASALAAAKWLGSLVKNTPAEVAIVQVFPPLRAYGQPLLNHEAWVQPDVPIDAARKNTADLDGRQLREYLGLPETRVRQIVAVGKPQDEILFALQDIPARAIILGEPSRGLTHRLWRVAVAQLQRRSPVPVIVVPLQGDPQSTHLTPRLSRAG